MLLLLRQKIDDLQAENEELKKAKQDEQLNEFDYVTRKEAADIKDEEKVSLGSIFIKFT